MTAAIFTVTHRAIYTGEDPAIDIISTGAI
jgi:hypothetical protein